MLWAKNISRKNFNTQWFLMLTEKREKIPTIEKMPRPNIMIFKQNIEIRPWMKKTTKITCLSFFRSKWHFFELFQSFLMKFCDGFKILVYEKLVLLIQLPVSCTGEKIFTTSVYRKRLVLLSQKDFHQKLNTKFFLILFEKCEKNNHNPKNAKTIHHDFETKYWNTPMNEENYENHMFVFFSK